RQAAASPGLDFRGFHAHIGSQLFSVDPFLETVSRLMALAGETTRTTGRPMTELDLGGGLGIRYLEGDEPPAVEEMVAALVERVRREAEARNLPLPHLILEPGRSLIGEAGTTVYTVGSIKRVPGLPAFVAVDGGMSDNPRPALYDAQYTALLVPTGAGEAPRPLEARRLVGKLCHSSNGRPGRPASVRGDGATTGHPRPALYAAQYTALLVPTGGGEAPRPLEDCRIVGKLCESGDVLVKHCRLPSPQPGDLVGLLTT